MPRIPQVQLQGPSQQIQAPGVPQVQQAPDQLQQVARGLVQAGGGMVAAEVNWQQRQDKIDTKDATKATVEFQNLTLDLLDGTADGASTGYLGTSGSTALNQAPQTTKRLKELYDEVRGKLTTAQARELFDAKTTAFSRSALSRVQSHYDRQLRVDAQATARAERATAIREYTAAIRSQTILPITPEQAEDEQRAWDRLERSYHAELIAEGISEESEAGKALWDEHKSMFETQRAAIREQQDEANKRADAAEAAEMERQRKQRAAEMELQRKQEAQMNVQAAQARQELAEAHLRKLARLYGTLGGDPALRDQFMEQVENTWIQAHSALLLEAQEANNGLGWPEDTYRLERAKMVSGLHVDTIQGLLAQGNSTEAMVYYQTFGAEILEMDGGTRGNASGIGGALFGDILKQQQEAEQSVATMQAMQIARTKGITAATAFLSKAGPRVRMSADDILSSLSSIKTQLKAETDEEKDRVSLRIDQLIADLQAPQVDMRNEGEGHGARARRIIAENRPWLLENGHLQAFEERLALRKTTPEAARYKLFTSQNLRRAFPTRHDLDALRYQMSESDFSETLKAWEGQPSERWELESMVTEQLALAGLVERDEDTGEIKEGGALVQSVLADIVSVTRDKGELPTPAAIDEMISRKVLERRAEENREIYFAGKTPATRDAFTVAGSDGEPSYTYGAMRSDKLLGAEHAVGTDDAMVNVAGSPYVEDGLYSPRELYDRVEAALHNMVSRDGRVQVRDSQGNPTTIRDTRGIQPPNVMQVVNDLMKENKRRLDTKAMRAQQERAKAEARAAEMQLEARRQDFDYRYFEEDREKFRKGFEHARRWYEEQSVNTRMFMGEETFTGAGTSDRSGYVAQISKMLGETKLAEQMLPQGLRAFIPEFRAAAKRIEAKGVRPELVFDTLVRPGEVSALDRARILAAYYDNTPDEQLFNDLAAHRVALDTPIRSGPRPSGIVRLAARNYVGQLASAGPTGESRVTMIPDLEPKQPIPYELREQIVTAMNSGMTAAEVYRLIDRYFDL